MSTTASAVAPTETPTETPAAVAAYAGRTRSSAVSSAGSDPVTDSLDLADLAAVLVLRGFSRRPPKLSSPRARNDCDHRCTHGFRVRPGQGTKGEVCPLAGSGLMPRMQDSAAEREWKIVPGLTSAAVVVVGSLHSAWRRTGLWAIVRLISSLASRVGDSDPVERRIAQSDVVDAVHEAR